MKLLVVVTEDVITRRDCTEKSLRLNADASYTGAKVGVNEDMDIPCHLLHNLREDHVELARGKTPVDISARCKHLRKKGGVDPEAHVSHCFATIFAFSVVGVNIAVTLISILVAHRTYYFEDSFMKS